MATKRKRGRILYPSISTSPRVARLSLVGALLWDYLIAHADDQGRLLGDASALRERLMPLRQDVTTADVEEGLEGMVRERLILRYRPPKMVPLIQIADWQKWNARMTYKHVSYLTAPSGWRDRVTARVGDLGPYVQRMVHGMIVFCPSCGRTVNPVARGRGWLCPNCEVELLGTRNKHPKVGGMQTRVTGRTRGLVLAALGSGPLTKPQLAAATGRSEATIGNLLPGLRRAGEVVRTRRKRPWTYRLKGSAPTC